MENKEIIENQKLANLSKQFEKLAKDQAIISAAIQYKKSQEIIDQKLKNENAAISYGIKRINKKVIENLNKYEEVEKEYKEIIEKYKSDLEELAKYHDTQIALGYAKILEEELKQKDIYIQLYHARKEEIIAKGRGDNSDDGISKNIYDMEEEISKSDLRIRRIRPTIRKKISEKQKELTSALETQEKEIQKESIKGPKIFDKATRFFLGKFNPTKQIQRNVFNNLKNRIKTYEESKNERKIKEEYAEENIAKTLEKIATKK